MSHARPVSSYAPLLDGRIRQKGLHISSTQVPRVSPRPVGGVKADESFDVQVRLLGLLGVLSQPDRPSGAVACGARGKEYDQPVSSAWSNPGELWQEHRAVTHADTESRVVKIVAQQLGVDKDLVTSDARFEGDLGAGEFDMAEMISLFETEFHISIADASTGGKRRFADP